MKHDEMGMTCSMHGEMRNSCEILVGKDERKEHLGDLSMDGGIIFK
jgi:hypothetical protein